MRQHKGRRKKSPFPLPRSTRNRAVDLRPPLPAAGQEPIDAVSAAFAEFTEGMLWV